MGISRSSRLCTHALSLLCLAFLLSTPALAQPFGGWISLLGEPSYHGYVNIPHHPALNFNGTGFTFEAWVSLHNNSSAFCHSIAGKNYHSNWWVGTVWDSGTQVLRSYLSNAYFDAGIVPTGTWTHVAVTYDGTRRIHYINGEKVGEVLEARSPSFGTADLRFGSDVDWQYSPRGSLNEIRLWNVARTQAQIRATINVPITSPMLGLVGAWDISGNNKVGAYDGTMQGTGIGGLTFPPSLGCSGSTSTGICLYNRFWVTMKWRTNPTPGTPTDGSAGVVPYSTLSSGLFYFFDPTIWEAMVKMNNGCGLNNRYWVFSAATTDVFYRLEIMDVTHGLNKIYFNYPGAAQALIDTSAFASCP